jgi:hypothetical protein
VNQVSHILLTGAGFSRNWGGWLANEVFEYLLGCREIDEDLRRDLWQTKLQGGNFEDTLSGLQDDFERRPTMNNQIRLNGLNDALIGMFKAMAKGFVRNFEWNRDKEYWVATFLNRFTSIFTLNQDTLLEQHYFFPASRDRWWHLPGMRPENNHDDRVATECPSDDFRLDSKLQPYMKLHGSCNWKMYRSVGAPILVMGGNKTASIKRFPILERYYAEFRRSIAQHGTRLMVIGYSFNDFHINQAIEEAVQAKSLKIFIIDPLGVDVLDKSGSKAQIISSKPNLEKIGPHIIGASRRPLSAIFGDDRVEFHKIYRFFEH